MPIDATAFGYVSNLWDEPSPADSTNIKVGGTCVWGTATSAMTPNDIVIADSAADDSYKTTTSANSTSVVGYVVAGWGSATGNGWDYTTAVVSGQKILILLKGVVLATASAAITRGARVGTSTTAGQVVTTTTQDAAKGIALQTASAQGDKIRVLV